MLQFKSLRALLAVYILFIAMPNLAWALSCHQIHLNVTELNQQRGYALEKINYHNDYSLLKVMQQQEQLGLVNTFFSKKWDTQVYYTHTAIPGSKGRTPLIDPEAKAVYIFLHGSGTMKSSGRNFIANMNTLGKLGYSAIAVDMPFHAEGPRHARYNRVNDFMEWLRPIVLEAKASGKPVYLAGHSFGPDVILEFVSRNPRLVDGVVAMSPASFTKELDQWYQQNTSRMNFGGDVAPNEAGGLWAGRISSQFLWSRGRLPDPTQINPNLKIRVLSGNREEYVPAPLDPVSLKVIGDNTYDISVPLKKIFSRAEVVIEPNIGHYLFDHVDRNGYNVVLRELLAVDGVQISKQTIRNMLERTSAERLAYTTDILVAKRYTQDPVFRAWADLKYGTGQLSRKVQNGNEALAKKITADFEVEHTARMNLIYQKILATKETHPDFYNRYKDQIDRADPKKIDQSLFYPYYQQVLSAQ